MFIFDYTLDVTLSGPRDIVANDVSSVLAEKTNITLYHNTDKM